MTNKWKDLKNDKMFWLIVAAFIAWGIIVFIGWLTQ